MKRPFYIFLFLLIPALFGLSSAAAGRHSPDRQSVAEIKGEIRRLQQLIKDQQSSDKYVAETISDAKDTLKAAGDALSAGQLYLSLEKLEQAGNMVQSLRRGLDSAEVAKGGFAAFDAEWGKVSVHLTALDKEAHARDWKNAPLGLRGLAEAAQGQSIPLLESGRGFAAAVGPHEGLFYIGQAEGEADFATFCASLNLASEPATFALRSLLPELESLQKKTNDAYQPPKSVELHSRFIALNSSIKLAEELDASRFYAGALYAYLNAVRHYGMLHLQPPDAARLARLKEDLAEERKKLAASTSDDSMAQLYLERAEGYIAHADSSAPTVDEWKAARSILDNVLPAYYAAQKPPAAFAERASGKTIDITLVRWPYT